MDRGFSAAMVFLFLFAVLTAPVLPSAPQEDINLEGYIPVQDIKAEGNSLTFDTGCYRLHMIVSEKQTEAIRRGLFNVTPRRPLTHDFFATTLTRLGADLEAVKIYGLERGSYRAYLVLEKGGTIVKIDSRPSDATALAARTLTPIYVNKDVLREAGEDTCKRGGRTL